MIFLSLFLTSRLWSLTVSKHFTPLFNSSVTAQSNETCEPCLSSLNGTYASTAPMLCPKVPFRITCPRGSIHCTLSSDLLTTVMSAPESMRAQICDRCGTIHASLLGTDANGRTLVFGVPTLLIGSVRVTELPTTVPATLYLSPGILTLDGCVVRSGSIGVDLGLYQTSALHRDSCSLWQWPTCSQNNSDMGWCLHLETGV